MRHQDVEARTDGDLRLTRGVVPLRLRDVGRGITEVAKRPVARLDAERRRYYRLPPFGTAVATRRDARLSQLVRLAAPPVSRGDPPDAFDSPPATPLPAGSRRIPARALRHLRRTDAGVFGPLATAPDRAGSHRDVVLRGGGALGLLRQDCATPPGRSAARPGFAITAVLGRPRSWSAPTRRVFPGGLRLLRPLAFP